MTNDIYNILGIEKSRLKRDYVNNPLKKIKVVRAHNGTQVFETPCKEDLEYLINECFLSTYSIGKLMGKSEKLILVDMRNYNISRTPEVTKRMKDKCKTIPNEYRFKNSVGRINEKNKRQQNAIEKKNKKILDNFTLTDKIYNELHIDKSRLKRDYVKNPLLNIIRNGDAWIGLEYPEKEDFEYLYMELKLLREDVARFFNIKVPYVKKLAHLWGFKKDKKITIKKMKEKVLKNIDKMNYPKMEIIPEGQEYDVFRRYNIDPKRLKRDYIKYPHVYMEEFDIEEVKYLYIDCNVNIKDMSKIYGCENCFTPIKILYKEGIVKPQYKVAYKLKKTDYALSKKICSELEKNNELSEEEYNKITEQTYKILKNKEEFSRLIDNSPSLYDAVKQLRVSETTILKYINKYKIYTHWQSKPISKCERKLRDYLPIGTYNIRVEGYEMDIFYPKFSFGIEYNGVYWHSDVKRNSDYHYNKSKFFSKYGVFVYNILQYEDKGKKFDIVISDIKRYLSECDWTYDESTHNVAELNKTETNVFLKNNSLYPILNYDLSIGLKYKDGNELHQVMTFKKDGEDSWHIVQNCYDLNTIVFFGCEKIFNYFKEKYNPEYIISYVDNAKDNGEWLKDLGFEYILDIDPYYWWNKGNIIFKGNDIEYITKYRKKYNDFITPDEELFKNNGFLKIYDCGYDVYIWKNK